jgi:transcriptional regulator with XRE-family HTH domain
LANIESGRQRIAAHHLYALAIALQVQPASLLPPVANIEEIDKAVTRLSSDPEVLEFTQRVLGQDVAQLMHRRAGAE